MNYDCVSVERGRCLHRVKHFVTQPLKQADERFGRVLQRVNIGWVDRKNPGIIIQSQFGNEAAVRQSQFDIDILVVDARPDALDQTGGIVI